jgi:tetratricopeptide (TPR) repeat protein
MVRPRHLIMSLCVSALTLIAMRDADAQTSPPAAKTDSPFHQCQTTNDDTVAMATCPTVIQDKTETPEHRAIAYTAIGFVALDQNQNALAIDDFTKSLALDPNSDSAYSGRAIIEFRLAQYDSAIADAKNAVELNPQVHPEAYLLLGTLADRNGDHDARIAYMNKAISILPSYAAAYAGRGHGYEDEKKYDQALADFNKAISLDSSLASALKPDFIIVYIERASNSIQLGHYPAGIEDLKSALQLDPANARALGDLGDAYNATNKYEDAIAVLSHDIEVNPDYSFAYADRGIAYLNLGKNDLALIDLNKAIQLGDHDYTTYFARGEVYQNQSNQAAALADYQKSLELASPDYPYRDNIEKAIKSAEQ